MWFLGKCKSNKLRKDLPILVKKKKKKKIQRLFKEYDLEITAESNQKFVNSLDLTLNLKDGTFRPYHKPGNQMQYIHTESNHPPKYY